MIRPRSLFNINADRNYIIRKLDWSLRLVISDWVGIYFAMKLKIYLHLRLYYVVSWRKLFPKFSLVIHYCALHLFIASLQLLCIKFRLTILFQQYIRLVLLFLFLRLWFFWWRGPTDDQNWELNTTTLPNFKYTLDLGEAPQKVLYRYIFGLAWAHQLRLTVSFKTGDLTLVVFVDSLKFFDTRNPIVV